MLNEAWYGVTPLEQLDSDIEFTPSQSPNQFSLSHPLFGL